MKIIVCSLILAILIPSRCEDKYGRLLMNVVQPISLHTFHCLKGLNTSYLRLNAWLVFQNVWFANDYQNALTAGYNMIDAQVWLTPTMDGNQPASLPATSILSMILDLDVSTVWVGISNLGYWYRDVQQNRQYVIDFISTLLQGSVSVGILSDPVAWKQLLGDVNWSDAVLSSTSVSYVGLNDEPNYSDWKPFAQYLRPSTKAFYDDYKDCNIDSAKLWHS